MNITHPQLRKIASAVIGGVFLLAMFFSVPAYAAPTAPIVTFPSSPHSTTTDPITIYGTADATTTVSITGGVGTSTASTTASGSWSASVDLTASSTNTLSIVAIDAMGSSSAATTLVINHMGTSTSGTTTVATSSPIITLSGGATTTIFVCNGFEEPGFSAVDSSGASIAVTTSGSVGTEPGTYTILYTAVDAQGHSTTTTRTVVALNCSSGSGGGSGRSNAPFITVTPATSGVLPPGPPIATPPVQFIANPGGFVPQVSVLGVSTNPSVTMLFQSNMGFGSRGPEVVALQIRLKETGYFNGPATGYYGPLTRAAVRAFQRDHGVSMTGFVGPLTRAVLNS